MTPAIELLQVSRRFRGSTAPIVAVDHIDLRIEPGEVVALLGPNGAGKTTTLDMVLGLSAPTSGSINVFGMAPRAAVAAGRVAAVLQTGGLLPDLTVAETVEFIAATYSNPEPVTRVLELANLTAISGRRVSKCSGGEQQRLRFALALLPRPDLLILDEPTAGMDVNARRDFWAQMHAEAREGRTVVFATHYLEEADDFADRTVLMSGGRIVADGPTEEIRAKATGRWVSADLADPARAIDRFGGQLVAQRFVVRAADSDSVARALLTEFGATNLEVVSGSLEDAFVALTEGAAK